MLFVLGLVLNAQVLALVTDGIEISSDPEELRVLVSLDARVFLLFAGRVPCGRHELSSSAFAFLPLAQLPPTLPIVAERGALLKLEPCQSVMIQLYTKICSFPPRSLVTDIADAFQAKMRKLPPCPHDGITITLAGPTLRS